MVNKGCFNKQTVCLEPGIEAGINEAVIDLGNPGSAVRSGFIAGVHNSSNCPIQPKKIKWLACDKLKRRVLYGEIQLV